MTLGGLRRPGPAPSSPRPDRTAPQAGSGLTLTVSEAAATSAAVVLERLHSTAEGLTSAEAARRLALIGPNAVRTHRARLLTILGRQLRSAVLILLGVTAFISFFLGQRTDTVVIAVILLASVGLGFVNKYRAERATEALHSKVTHVAVALRDGHPAEVDVTTLVPGDVVRVALGEVVPADLRLLESTGLECDESVLTGESQAAAKTGAPVPAGSALGDLTSSAFMGTVVRAGGGAGVVVATGARAEFGKIAAGLGDRQPETDFQVGLRHFSVLLLQVH
jgi:Mg2+-importing ATPase